MENLEEEQRKMRERIHAAKLKKAPIQRGAQRNFSEVKDIETLLKRIETLEAENASLRHQLSVSRDQPRLQERSDDLSESERRHLFMKYSNVRRY